MMDQSPYSPKNKVRVVTAASLFDGHDAAINIMRRIIQSTGCEVIHLGHDRSVEEVVNAAINEDAQAIAMTSYQGGHNEYFRYMYDLLKERGAEHIKIFGGGGGVILPEEIKELMDYGITRIYSPDDGRAMGLQGMINDLVSSSDFPTGENILDEMWSVDKNNPSSLAQVLSAVENFNDKYAVQIEGLQQAAAKLDTPVLGITGTGGAGKSSLVDEFVRRFLLDQEDKHIAIVSVDPSKRKTGGALLGDRIRMNAINHPRVFMRSLATRQANLALSKHINQIVQVLKVAGYDLILLETSGIGQSDTEIADHSDVSMYVMTPEYGAATQLEKIDMLDFADVVALNKFDKRGALDALRDVKKQVQRNRGLWHDDVDSMPVHGTIASQFNDPGTNALYLAVMQRVSQLEGCTSLKPSSHWNTDLSEKIHIIPPKRVRYLSEITENNARYEERVNHQVALASKLGQWTALRSDLSETAMVDEANARIEALKKDLDDHLLDDIHAWDTMITEYSAPDYNFQVRDKTISIKTHTTSLSHQEIPKIALPKFTDWGDRLRWLMRENVPGKFPYTAGIYPFKRQGEDPTRMFAGEGGPERTNRRFHYLSADMPAKRLSTAFDSVTLYGRDPGLRPDIYGKIGNAGVSVCCLDDAKRLYSGFDLCDPSTSVSMTINGPAPMVLAFFLNAAIDQQCELYITEHGLEDKVEALRKERFGDNPPVYQGEIPHGHNGLGTLLWGYRR